MLAVRIHFGGFQNFEITREVFAILMLPFGWAIEPEMATSVDGGASPISGVHTERSLLFVYT